ncbi:hypothetical protein H0A66_12345 [Alcaligenaceae bacterium]|nr:hypothetical protein [Alcaligenaceae bacterium]
MLVSASASSSRASAELAAQTTAADTPRLPFVSTRRTPTAALSFTHPRQLRNRELAGLTALQSEKLVLLARLVGDVILLQMSLMQKVGCVGGCAGALRKPLRSAPSRRQGRGCLSPALVGPLVRPGEFRGRLDGAERNGNPARGAAREAETASDTPDLLKNEKTAHNMHPPLGTKTTYPTYLKLSCSPSENASSLSHRTAGIE